METWTPVGDPLETIDSDGVVLPCTPFRGQVLLLEHKIRTLQDEAAKLSANADCRRVAPRGRTYKNWKHGLTSAEIQLLEKNGMPVTKREPSNLNQMKELIRAARNAESAIQSRARVRATTERSVRGSLVNVPHGLACCALVYANFYCLGQCVWRTFGKK